MHKTLFFKLAMLSLCLGMVNCGKQKNQKLAQNYYKLSMAELSRTVNSPGDELLAYKQALSYLDKALEQQKNAEYLALKATLLLKLNRLEESKKNFKFALKEKTTPALKGEILNNYACLLAQCNQRQDAFAVWRDLVDSEYYLTPEVAYVNQGRVLAAENNYQQAKECFLKAIELAPDYLDAHYYLAVLAQQHGDKALAKNVISTALFLEPDNKGMHLLAQQLGIKGEQPFVSGNDWKSKRQTA